LKEKPIVKLTRLFALVLSLGFFIIAIVSESNRALDTSVLLLWIVNVLYALESINKRAFYMAFLVAFFAFLLGRTVANIIMPSESIYLIADDILFHTKLCLFISLLSLFFFYGVNEKVRFNCGLRNGFFKEPYKGIEYYDETHISIRMASKYGLYATYIFAVIVAIEKIVFVSAFGYSQYYILYASSLPYLVSKMGDAFQVCFFMYLATMPNRNEAKIPVVMYLFLALLALAAGRRADFVVPVLLIILYCFTRNLINNNGETWLTRRHLMIALMLSPFLLGYLFLRGAVRFTGGSALSGDISLISQVVNFFNELGFSANVISFGKMYENQIPNKIYSFGETIDYLRENIITQMFFDFPIYRSQTVERAMNSHNFTQIITYIRDPRFYLSGRGLGSSYIAEAYHDFGYVGVVLWNAFYAFLLSHFYNYKGKGIIYVAMSLCVLKAVLIAPRNVASGFLTQLINLDTWLIIGLICIMARVLRGKNFLYMKPATKKDVSK